MEYLIIDSAKVVAIQDRGRFGYENYGVAVNGAVDSYAHMMGNVLVGNLPFAPSLEITAFDFSMRSTKDIHVCVTGAPADITIGGQPVNTWSSVILPAGESLTVRKIRKGLRVYIAIQEGIETANVLGSCAPDTVAQIGSKVFKGQKIPIKQTSDIKEMNRAARPEDVPQYGSPWKIRICPGPDQNIFRNHFDSFLKAAYTVSPASNHVGIRLSGPAIKGHYPTEVLSRGAGIGAVEILPTGQPLVLHRGRGVTAGYPIVAVVSTVDLGLMGQARPGDQIQFTSISKQEAVQLWRQQFEKITAYQGNKVLGR